jgi:hypothetical protein
VVRLDRARSAQHEGVLNRVLEFANVARIMCSAAGLSDVICQSFIHGENGVGNGVEDRLRGSFYGRFADGSFIGFARAGRGISSRIR